MHTVAKTFDEAKFMAKLTIPGIEHSDSEPGSGVIGGEKRVYQFQGARAAITDGARATIARLRACRAMAASQRDSLAAEMTGLLMTALTNPADARKLDVLDNRARKILSHLT